MALGDAFVAGAFPALTMLSTPELHEEEAENVIAFIHVLKARAAPMLMLRFRDHNLPQVVFQVLADALLTPAFASLQELVVWNSSSEACASFLEAFRAGAGEHFEVLTFRENTD